MKRLLESHTTTSDSVKSGSRHHDSQTEKKQKVFSHTDIGKTSHCLQDQEFVQVNISNPDDKAHQMSLLHLAQKVEF